MCSRRRCRRRESSGRFSACDRPARRTCCCTTTWARSTAHFDRGVSPRRHRRHLERHCAAPRVKPASRSGPTRRSRASGRSTARHRRRAGQRRRARGRRGAFERRSAPDFLKFLDARDLPGGVSSTTCARYQFRGSSGQGEPGARRAAGLHVPAWPGTAPARRYLDLAQRRLHGARVRPGEVRRVLAPTVHRHGHPDADGSVAGAAGQTHPVVLRAVRAVHARRRAHGTTSARRSAMPSSTRLPSTRRISGTSSCIGRC